MTDPQDRPDAEPQPVDASPSDAAPEATADTAATDAEPVTPEVAAPAIEPAATVAAEPAPAEGAEPAPDEAGEPATAPERPKRRERAPKAATPGPRPLAPYAIIETGGKQYRVSVGDTLSVERLPAEAGSEITIDRVLLLGGDGATRVGTPTVAGAAVTARVEDHLRGEKIVVFKYKAKKRYRRRQGHRQELTRLTITGIAG